MSIGSKIISLREWLRERFVQNIFLLILWAGVALLSLSPVWRSIEWAEFDWLTIFTAPAIEETPIVLVKIDEPSLKEINRQWPWPRSLHAQLIRSLKDSGAAVIGFNVGFSEPSSQAEDQQLAEAIKQAGNVVLAAHYSLSEESHVVVGTFVEPLEAFLVAGAERGVVSIGLESDLILRRFSVGSDAFWRRVLARFEPQATEIAPSSPALIRYIGQRNGFPSVSYYQALDPQRYLPPDLLKGRIVLVGSDLESDRFGTPFMRVSGQKQSGIEVLANMIQAAMDARILRQETNETKLALLSVTALMTIFALGRWQPWRSAFIAASLSAALAGITLTAFVTANLWVPVSASIAGIWLAYLARGGLEFYREQAFRRFIRGAFGRYVDDKIIEHIVAHPEQLILGGVNREVSFIFTDIADFTTLTEQLPPTTLVSLINEYFDEMCEIVLKHKGTIERFTGDSIVAFFNAPVEQADHPKQAVQCAMEMDISAVNFVEKRRAKGIPLGVTRIGVNTGDVTVGNFGGAKRFHYTAMGDAINTAARLETANKYFGTRVCVSGETVSRCVGIAFRPIGDVWLKGKNQGIEVYELLSDKVLDHIDNDGYQKAYALLKQNDRIALEAFTELVSQNPSDYLSQFHLTRLQAGEIGTKIVLQNK